MTEIRAYHLTDKYIEINKPIRLETTSRTRRIFEPSFSVDDKGEKHLRGKFVYQKKGPTGWEDGDGLTLRDVPAGQAIRFELDTEAMNNFLDGIGVLLKTAGMASFGERSEKFNVAPRDKVIEISDESLKPTIETLINRGYGNEFWNQLANLRPEEAEKFADDQILKKRKASVRTFEEALQASTWDEPKWGRFFDDNKWIFGLGLRYQFLNQLQGQPHYGGSDLTGRGQQKGDYLHHTEGTERFVVLVEIKRPDSRIFQDDSRGKKYRNGVPGFEVEFANALSQIQVNSRTWETEGSRTDANRKLLEPKRIHTVHPRSLLIYGCTSELDTMEKCNCFELFRGQLKDTEIVTYDELLRRAQFIIGEMSVTSGPTE